MSVVDDFLKKMKMVSDDDDEGYDDDEYDEYDGYDDDEEEVPVKKPAKKAAKKKKDFDTDDEYDDADDESYYEPQLKKAPKETKQAASYSSKTSNVTPIGKGGGIGSSEVCMIMPKSFEDANTIADVLLSHKAVVLNLEGIDMSAAQRIIDFASGACYTVGGNLQKISKKIFMVVPSDVNLSGDFGELLGDMVDLNSVSMMK